MLITSVGKMQDLRDAKIYAITHFTTMPARIHIPNSLSNLHLFTMYVILRDTIFIHLNNTISMVILLSLINRWMTKLRELDSWLRVLQLVCKRARSSWCCLPTPPHRPMQSPWPTSLTVCARWTAPEKVHLERWHLPMVVAVVFQILLCRDIPDTIFISSLATRWEMSVLP